MAKIATATDEKVFKINKWLGVNQAQEGETRLFSGEAADMRNFRITAGGALRKRPGSRNVTGLLNAYSVSTDYSEVKTLRSENGASAASFEMYPTAIAKGTGQIELSGDPETVTNANADGHVGWYYQDASGKIYKFKGVRRGVS